MNASRLIVILRHCSLTMATWRSTSQYVLALADAFGCFVVKTRHHSVHRQLVIAHTVSGLSLCRPMTCGSIVKDVITFCVQLLMVLMSVRI